MGRLALDETAEDETTEPVSRDQILRREWRQGNIYFPRSSGADTTTSQEQYWQLAAHERDWQPYRLWPKFLYVMIIHHYIALSIVYIYI